jgi:S-adenosylmethionine-dependent methyltransferase
MKGEDKEVTMVNQFNEHLHKFQDEQLKPWGVLRYEIALANLERHMPGQNLHVLDAGGGNGVEAMKLARAGQRVTLLDPSAEMLEAAKRSAEEQEVADRVTFIQGELENIPTRFGKEHFDAVLCHNVIQYLDEPKTALAGLCEVLTPGGILSVVAINRYSESFRLAVQQMDLGAALDALERRELRTVTFDTLVKGYTLEEIARMISGLGCEVLGEYGIRCVCDYIPDNQAKFEPDFFSHLEKLELAMSGRHPYNLLGRSLQVIARKMPS